MKKALHLSLLLISFTLIFPSCVSKKKWTELMSEKDTLNQTLSNTQEEVATLKTDLENLDSEKTQLAADYKEDKEGMTKKLDQFESDLGMMKKEKEEMLASIKEANDKYDNTSKQIQSEIDKFTPKGFALNQQGDRLYVNGAEQVRFKSGSARIKKESKEMLKPIAEMLMANKGAMMLVEGHTDNVPMKATARYASNKELSKARANAVIKALVKMGVDKGQLTAVGHGEDKPQVTYAEGENMDEARAMNRRADLAIMVSPSMMVQMAKAM